MKTAITSSNKKVNVSDEDFTEMQRQYTLGVWAVICQDVNGSDHIIDLVATFQGA